MEKEEETINIITILNVSWLICCLLLMILVVSPAAQLIIIIEVLVFIIAKIFYFCRGSFGYHVNVVIAFFPREFEQATNCKLADERKPDSEQLTIFFKRLYLHVVCSNNNNKLVLLLTFGAYILKTWEE
jgi:hypothetical protein